MSGPRGHHPCTPFALVLAVAVLVTACDRDDGRTLEPPTEPLPATTTTTTATTLPAEPAEPTPPAPLELLAPWPDGGTIPDAHTCFGDGRSPALTWTALPAGTVELAVTLTDLDDGRATRWIVGGLQPDRTGLAEGSVPDGALVWEIEPGSPGYRAPCPPDGSTHRYQFTVHALNQQLELADDASAAEVIEILNLIAIEQGSVTGTVTAAE